MFALILALLASISVSGCQLHPVQPSRCSVDIIAGISPPYASINYVNHVPQNGTFGDEAAVANATGLPEGCAVGIKVLSSNTSSFSFAMFLPTAWNSRFMATGNGGFGGFTNWSGTDTGHISGFGDTSWALGNPEAMIDWGYRAMHGSVVLGKEVVRAYYGSPAKFSYYVACSTGGRQGLKEVQEFPKDFDAVVVNAPAWWSTRLGAAGVQRGVLNLPSDDPKHIPSSLLQPIVDEMVKQCDPQDGIADNIIMYPYACKFRLEAMLCTQSNNNASTCLAPSQIGTLRHLISDYVDVIQTFIFPGPSLSSSLGFVASGTEKPSAIGLQYIINMVMNDINWNWRSFNYETVQTIDRIDPGNLTADNYDLAPFKARGGKLIHLHGLADDTISSGASIYFYEEVYKTMGVKLDDFYRMFLVPGLFHCTGSTEAPWFTGIPTITGATHGVPGHNDADHNGVLAIVRWVEEGIAPEKTIATKYNSDNDLKEVASQRPICPYPTKARYVAGDLDMATSWNCT
ncbi:putative ferulic acid Esterase/Feruloyl esterase [Colletotrichum phormii]|uniref:Carboxylic ester hydrolase n=1 Tax=Colletotrichum phormii TaxID=359342 RepID=A0AAJ0A5P7_9PEZI|nr:putative ferulic acid Esterase/Feruloyl esterase [Colletotrichum phormii]KAK1655060.1 putative ferulic acid Esterase/Feruloyl esterase [Colletotrichum phormii]